MTRNTYMYMYMYIHPLPELMGHEMHPMQWVIFVFIHVHPRTLGNFG